MSTSSSVPAFIKATEQPEVSDLLVVDEALPLMPLIRTLAEGGYTIINRQDGHLVITRRPAEFRGRNQ